MHEDKTECQIVPFDYHGHPIRVLMFHDGHREWFAMDACEALSIADPTSAIRGLDADETGRFTDPPNQRNGGIPRTYVTVTEAGLYKLILRSRKPTAKVFSRWVTHEVLPAIQRQGYYVTPGNEAKALSEIQAKLMEMSQQQIQMATEMARYRAAYEGERTTVAQLNARVDALSLRFKDFDDDHPNGLFGRKEARELRGMICQMRDILLQLGSQKKPLTIFNKIDNKVRSRVGYVRCSGASWEFATISMGREAKSFAATELETARQELHAEQRRDKRKNRERQLDLGFESGRTSKKRPKDTKDPKNYQPN